MDLDALLFHYFHTDDLAQVDPEPLARGIEQIRLDFGVENEPGRKFALWVVMEALGVAPPPAQSFDQPGEQHLRQAAQDWQRAAGRMAP